MQNSATLTCFAARIEMHCASVPELAELLLPIVLVRCELVMWGSEPNDRAGNTNNWPRGVHTCRGLDTQQRCLRPWHGVWGMSRFEATTRPHAARSMRTCGTASKRWRRRWRLTLRWRLRSEYEVVIHGQRLRDQLCFRSLEQSCGLDWKFHAICLHVVTAWRMLFGAGYMHCPCPCAPPMPGNQSVVVAVVVVCVSVRGVRTNHTLDILVSHPLHVTVNT